MFIGKSVVDIKMTMFIGKSVVDIKMTDNLESEKHEKKKLLIATDNFLPRWDGIARFLSEIIPRLLNTYDITVVAPDFGAYEDPNIKIVRMPLSKFLKVGDFSIPKVKYGVVNKLVKDSDIVFSQTIGPIGSVAINASKRYKKPLAAFIHSIEWELVPKALNNPLLKKYSQIIAKKVAKNLYNKCNLLLMPSNNIADMFLWNNIRTRSEVAHLGVDTLKFVPTTPEKRVEIRKSLGYTDEDIIIGYHGRISREKDLITLLRAFMRLQIHHDNVKLLIIGDGVNSIKKQLAVRKDVLLTGAKNNPVSYLQAMDIYCLTSLTETTCLSVLEAMSCQLAVVSTEVGFIKNYIKNNQNGLFFQKQSPYHMARQVERLIFDLVLRQKLGENARRTVIEQFSWDKTARNIEKALSSIK
jgi:glycosyltransferase involved in cell wall biosynthesis